jgi:hypothetical protein
MARRAWCPKGLMQYNRARQVLGVFLPEGKEEDPSPEKYSLLYDQKVEALIQQDPDWLETLETELETRAWYYLRKTDPIETITANMKLDSRWTHPRSAVMSFLGNQRTLDHVKDYLAIDQESEKSLVGREAFRKELEELTLTEFLELAIVPMR